VVVKFWGQKLFFGVGRSWAYKEWHAEKEIWVGGNSQIIIAVISSWKDTTHSLAATLLGVSMELTISHHPTYSS